MRNRLLITFVLLHLFYVQLTQSEEVQDVKKTRDGKVLSVFQIVRFANDPCDASGNKNGTCYTAEECESKGGTSSGSCASGYGVCCVFSIGCGARSSENCTYFESTSTINSGACAAKVCPCNNNICQLRLDFENFVIAGPSTVSTSVVLATKGQVIVAGTKQFAAATQCLTDTFSVSNDAYNQPQICGVNRGQHMYIEADEDCNDLVFQFGNDGIGTTIPNRMFSIKVSQYSCDYNNLAPAGCTQYFYGSNTNQIQSFNFNDGNGVHLANQDQSFCVRRERGQCRICWWPTEDEDFHVSGPTTAPKGYTAASVCCGYSAAKLSKGFDCVNIPGAEKKTDGAVLKGPNFCGRKLTSKSDGVANKSICSNRTPFYLRFRTDGWEYTAAKMEAVKVNKGIRMTFLQDTENCP